MFKMSRSSQGFTLAELLIALAILGVIATFTIPKILSSSTNGQNTAIAKEAASMISGAHQNLSLTTGITSGTTPGALTQYMNYVSVDNSSTTFNFAEACSATEVCLRLHNGGVLQYDSADTFGGTGTTNSIQFNVDPDGTGTQTPATFVLYANGRLTSGANGTGSYAFANSGLTEVTTDPAYILNWK